MANELGSISQWLIGLRDGDADAAAALWRRYFDRLTHLARRRLGSMPRRVVDEEDVALSAFDSFCRAAAAGRFPKLDDRDDLWQVLVLIAARKAASAGRQARRQKRGRGLVRGHSCFGQAIDGDDGWRAIVADEPSPEVAAAVAEEYQRLMTTLGDETLRSIAQWKLEGYSNAEIAGRLGRQTRTVERKLHLIRTLWLEAQPAAQQALHVFGLGFALSKRRNRSRKHENTKAQEYDTGVDSPSGCSRPSRVFRVFVLS